MIKQDFVKFFTALFGCQGQDCIVAGCVGGQHLGQSGSGAVRTDVIGFAAKTFTQGRRCFLADHAPGHIV